MTICSKSFQYFFLPGLDRFYLVSQVNVYHHVPSYIHIITGFKSAKVTLKLIFPPIWYPCFNLVRMVSVAVVVTSSDIYSVISVTISCDIYLAFSDVSLTFHSSFSMFLSQKLVFLDNAHLIVRTDLTLTGG